MKKTRTNKFKFFLFNIILMCLFLFNLSCGLDTFEVIEAPYQTTKKPEHNDVEEIQSYENKEFEFFTNETGNYSEITFLGTEVYYKIYNNFQTMYNERSGLITASESTSTSVSATQSLISKYKKLRVSNEQKTDLLIPKSPSNSPIKVNIRLTDYDANWCAKVLVNDNPINSDYEHSRPLRNMDSESTFNFDRDGDNNKIPADSVIIAIGQGAQTNIVKNTKQIDTNQKGLIEADKKGATTRPGVYAAGDVVSGARTVVEAVAATKLAAEEIDKYVKEKHGITK